MVNARLREGETDILPFLNCDRKNSGSCALIRHKSTEHRSILSADIATDTRPIYRPMLGWCVGRALRLARHIDRPQPISMSASLGRYFTATRPPLGRYFTKTWTISSRDLGTRLYLPYSTAKGFQWPSSFFPAMFFPRHRFYKRPSLLSEVAAFGACCFWRWAKVDIKSWYNCALFLPQGWVFQF